MGDAVFQRCIHPHCGATLPVDDTSFHCPKCGGLLDVAYDWSRLSPPKALKVGHELVPGVKLAEVHARYVMLSDGGVMKRIDLATRLLTLDPEELDGSRQKRLVP